MRTSAAYRELIRLVGEAEGVERASGVQCVLTVTHVAGRLLLEPEPFGQEHQSCVDYDDTLQGERNLVAEVVQLAAIKRGCACLKPHSALDVHPIRLHAEDGIVYPVYQSTGGIVQAMDTQWWGDSVHREMC